MLIVVYAPSCGRTRCLVLSPFFRRRSRPSSVPSPLFLRTTYLKGSSRHRILSHVRAVIRQDDPRQKQEGET
jgi:hypothetical protein